MARFSRGEPVYQNTEPPEPHRHVGHGGNCGLTGVYTYIRCLGECEALIPWPSSLEGGMSHYCPTCWLKYHPSERTETLARAREQGVL